MPRKKWIDKSAATTYSLVHRPLNDPLIDDESSSSMVFQEVAPPQARKYKTRSDIESEISQSVVSEDWSLRDNEGEAAQNGVWFDDTKYDYMQHLRDINNDNIHFIDKGKGKARPLHEALQELDLQHEREMDSARGKLMDEQILPSKNLRHMTYQNQQNIPDALAGFQPDMDPRLREVLEALEDEEYVDNEDQDLFDGLATGDEELDLDEFEGFGFDDEEEGWESDHTAKPLNEYKVESNTAKISVKRQSDDPDPRTTSLETTSTDANALSADLTSTIAPADPLAPIPDAPADPLAAYHASKAAPSSQTVGTNARARPAQSSILSSNSLLSASGRRKKRKGALTNPSAYSMTSSALHRTEGLTLLDARFDKIMEDYNEDSYDDDDGAFGDDDTASLASGMTGGGASVRSGVSRASGMSRMSGVSRSSSQAPELVQRDFGSVMGVMDEFLNGHSMQGKRRVKKGGYQTGIEQLDEIRKDLGRGVVRAGLSRG